MPLPAFDDARAYTHPDESGTWRISTIGPTTILMRNTESPALRDVLITAWPGQWQPCTPTALAATPSQHVRPCGDLAGCPRCLMPTLVVQHHPNPGGYVAVTRQHTGLHVPRSTPIALTTTDGLMCTNPGCHWIGSIRDLPPIPAMERDRLFVLLCDALAYKHVVTLVLHARRGGAHRTGGVIALDRSSVRLTEHGQILLGDIADARRAS